VTAHVGECFLHDPVSGLVHIGRKRPLGTGHAIFRAGAVICGTLFRSDPLRTAESATATPAGPAAQQTATAHAG
jgi:hypothetical protein